MELMCMEPEREARLRRALRLLSDREYLDRLVSERFSRVCRNIDFSQC